MQFVRLLGVLIVFLAGAQVLSGQSYAAASITNDFATHNISATGTILVGGAATDDGQEVVNFPVGFTFNYFGAPYTSCVVNSNGWISLGSTLQTTDTLVMRTPPTSVPSAAAPNNYIAGQYDDLNPASPTGGKVKWQLLSAPSRFVVLYDQVHHYQFGPTTAHFAIVLYQTTDIIEIHYSTGQTIITAPTSAAIENGTGTDGTARPGGINVIPVPTDAFRFTPPANFAPAIAVVRSAGTTPVAIAASSSVNVAANSTVAALDLRFTVTDTSVSQTLTLTAGVAPSANITGFVQAQWNAGPAISPVNANPLAGTFTTTGPITVTLSATDGVAAPTMFVFTIIVVPPPLNGNYTISQTPPADFSSIGAAFDVLEAAGVAGPVTLTIMDSATYTSNASYTLGTNSTTPIPAITPITGVSAVNRVTLRAATGQSPKVQGNATGAVLIGQSATLALSGRGALCINHSYVTVEGLEVFGGPNFGIMVQGNVSGAYTLNVTDVIIRRCKVHDIPDGPGIANMSQNGAYATNILIEHNFVWNCFTASGNPTTSAVLLLNTGGGITLRNPASASGIVRHNTVLHTSTFNTTGGIYAYASSTAYALNSLNNNIVVCTNPTTPALNLQSVTHAPTVANCNFNSWFATTLCNQATLTPFATWQVTGRDANGLNVDPLLVSTTGTIDLHLQNGSPCINPVGQTSTATIDIDGDVRPQGASVDIGADESAPPPEIDVQYNLATVADAGSVNVGVLTVAGAPFTFTVLNGGPGNLLLNGTPAVVVTPGLNCDLTTAVQVQPALVNIPNAGSTTFTVLADPTNPGAFNFTVSISNNDGDENPYNFTVNGTAIPVNAPAVANFALGSSFAGPQNGPFMLTVGPGAVLANANISLSDPESDNIIVNSITPVAGTPTGVTAPPIGAAAHPVALSWTGTADATNPPGVYSWTINFEDTVNGTPVVITVSIEISDVAPANVPAVGIVGAGSVGLPYLSTYTVGLTGALDVDLAGISDANTSQVVSITGTTQTGGPIGTGFQFALVGGFLNMAPAGTLVAADAGVQVWEVTISDGTNNVLVFVSVTVNPAITFTSATNLPDAIRNSAYPGSAVTTAGGTGAVTLAITSGALPSGMALSAGGAVSGSTTDAAGGFNFSVTATDTLGASTALAFTINVIDPPAGMPVISNATALPVGTLNAAYSVNLTVTGGTAPYTFVLDSGTLPAGLTLSTAGVISGTPNTIGPNTFDIRVTDSSAPAVSNTQTFTLQIIAPAKDDDSSGGCAAGAGAGLGLFVLAPMAALFRRRRK